MLVSQDFVGRHQAGLSPFELDRNQAQIKAHLVFATSHITLNQAIILLPDFKILEKIRGLPAYVLPSRFDGICI